MTLVEMIMDVKQVLMDVVLMKNQPNNLMMMSVMSLDVIIVTLDAVVTDIQPKNQPKINAVKLVLLDVVQTESNLKQTPKEITVALDQSNFTVAITQNLDAVLIKSLINKIHKEP